MNKLHGSRLQRHSQSYSSNTILNSLIKQKLQTEMKVIKENFAEMVKKQQTTPHRPTSHRKVSRPRAHSLTPQKIKASLKFNPLTKAADRFIASRQYQSFLLSADSLKTINSAREKSHQLSIKMSKKDKYRYEPAKSVEQVQELTEGVHRSTIKQIGEDIWLPEQPQLTNMLERKEEQMEQQLHKDRQLQWGAVMNRFTTHQQIDTPPLVQEQEMVPVQYDINKYQKQDYSSLQAWLQKSIQKWAQQPNTPINAKLNTFYGIYLCAWKQFIRLMYIESADKALLIEKLLFSLLRLFRGILSEEHTMSRNEHQTQQEQLKTINKLMQQRMDKLSNSLNTHRKELSSLKTQNHKLSQGYLTYRRVNRQLFAELEQMTEERNKLSKEISKVSFGYEKTLKNLQENGLVEVDERDNTRNYFTVGKDGKPSILGRFDDQEKDALKKEEESMKVLYNRYGEKIKGIQNEVNSYWSQKQDDLDIDRIIRQELLNLSISTIGVGADQASTKDISIQFPETDKNPLTILLQNQKEELTEKFQHEKQLLHQQISHLEQTINRWKQSYKELSEKYTSATHANHQHEQEIHKLEQAILNMKEDMEKSSSQKYEFMRRISELEEKQEEMRQEIIRNECEIKQTNWRIEEQKKHLQRERDNNRMLVKQNIQFREQNEQGKKQHEQLQKKIKYLVPHLQKFIEQVEQSQSHDYPINLQTLHNTSTQIQSHLASYLHKDSVVFLTKV